MTRTLTTLLAAIALTATLAACSSDDGSTKPDPTVVPSPPKSAESSPPPETSVAPSSTAAEVQESTTTTSTTTAEAPTSTTAQSTSTMPSESSPTANEDWTEIIQGLVNLRTQLYAGPDPARAGEVCADTAPCYQQLVAQITDLQSKGWRVVEQEPLAIVSSQLQGVSNENGVELAFVRTDIRRSDQHGRMVDGSGETIYDLVPEDSTGSRDGAINWTLIRLDGGWRILDQESIP